MKQNNKVSVCLFPNLNSGDPSISGAHTKNWSVDLPKHFTHSSGKVVPNKEKGVGYITDVCQDLTFPGAKGICP